MRHFGLIGRRLGHSFSRNYFSDKFLAEGIDASYELIELDDISKICALVKGDASLCGLNVTIPYKESVIPYLDELSSEAKAVGAVNCIAIKAGRMVGYNTDIEGIDATLNMMNITPNTKALVLGTGGASKAVAYILNRRNIPFMIVSRDAMRGDTTYDNLSAETITEHKLIINTTPLGMHPDVDSCPEVDYSAISSSHKIFDLVYNPEPTLFMRRCAMQGAKCLGGTAMLHCQAEASWRIWQQ
ncbi:MAG: shikimate dehydrogenase [Alistipes sp.]|nr:shikimate dehydrogenase [Alistipes sp.]